MGPASFEAMRQPMDEQPEEIIFNAYRYDFRLTDVHGHVVKKILV
jgi:hypothetical protein